MFPESLADLEMLLRGDPRRLRLVRKWYSPLFDSFERVCEGGEAELPGSRLQFADITRGCMRTKSFDYYLGPMLRSAISARNAAIRVLHDVSGLKETSIKRDLEPSAAPSLPPVPTRRSRMASATQDLLELSSRTILFFKEVRVQNSYAWRMAQREELNEASELTLFVPEIYRDGEHLRAFKRLLMGIEDLKEAYNWRTPSSCEFTRRRFPNPVPPFPISVAVFLDEFQNGDRWNMSQVEVSTKEGSDILTCCKVTDFGSPEVPIDRELVRVSGDVLVDIEEARRGVKILRTHPFDERPEASYVLNAKSTSQRGIRQMLLAPHC